MTMEGKAKDMLWADTDLGQGQVAREVFGLLSRGRKWRSWSTACSRGMWR